MTRVRRGVVTKRIMALVLASLVAGLVPSLPLVSAPSQAPGGTVRAIRRDSPKPARVTRTFDSESDTPSPAKRDALQRRTRAELRAFTDWLARKDAKGFIGEVGWPKHDERWNALGRVWYADAARAELWVTYWATGEWWGPNYTKSAYRAKGSDAVNAANPQAAIIEEQSAPRRGISVAGAEFGAPVKQATSNFSNASAGVYGRDYHYSAQATFNYLAARGITTVRIPFRWERLQPQLGSPLARQEWQRFVAAVNRAGSAGLKVIPDMHNYGAYYLTDGAVGGRRTMGSSQLTAAHFADVWHRIAGKLRANPHVLAYGIMNEPFATVGGKKGWEVATQQVVDAIRATGDVHTVLVPGYKWSTTVHFTTQHPGGPWIQDPRDNVRYEAHQYFDRDNSSAYAHCYDAEVRDARKRGY